MEPKCLDAPLVARCSIAYKPLPFHVSKWDMGQCKNSIFLIGLILIDYVMV